MSEVDAGTYSVEAYNLSHASENKIHDDAVAQKLGFSGGLVPGVEVYAYACHPVVRQWGSDWLNRGQMECRFLKPLYDGRLALVKARQDGGNLQVAVESEGVLCATATASLADLSSAPNLERYPVRQPPHKRPEADEISLAPGTSLGIESFVVTPDMANQYLRDVREADAIYATEGLVHPGQLLRLCNMVLKDNVALQPWIHTGSNITNFAAARVGDRLGARGRVAANYERKGHRLVELDIVLIASDTTVIAQVLHTAVYRLRQLG